MGLIEISGTGADDFLSTLSCNRISAALNQKMIYSMFCNDQGMILDDVMFGKLNNRWHLVVNGANRTKIRHWLNEHQPSDVQIKELNDEFTFIAVQGPESPTVLSTIFNSAINDCPRFGMMTQPFEDASCLLTRQDTPVKMALKLWFQTIRQKIYGTL